MNNHQVRKLLVVVLVVFTVFMVLVFSEYGVMKCNLNKNANQKDSVVVVPVK